MRPNPPDFETAREHVLREVVRFARVLRREGADVPANATREAVEALVRVGFDDRRRARAALYTTLLVTPHDREILAQHFEEFWYRFRTGLEASASVDTGESDGDHTDDNRGPGTDVDGVTGELDGEDLLEDETPDGELADLDGDVLSRRVGGDSTDPPDERTAKQRPGTYSAAGGSTAVEGSGLDTGGGLLDRATMGRFERALATVSGRRWSRSRTGDAVDARRALRESLDTGGVAVTLPERERARREFRACVLVDVSQSVIDAIDRQFLLSVLDTLVDDGRSVRVFFFDTDIREVTGVFETTDGDPAAALDRAEVAWGGGTRIGASLSTLRQQWPNAIDRRTVTLVVSDGLDVGEMETLRSGVIWLARRSRAVVWLNPLAGTDGYEPTCRGMATALPYADGLFAFAGPEDVEAIARHIERHGLDGSVGVDGYRRLQRSGGTSP